MKTEAEQLNRNLATRKPQEILASFLQTYGHRIALASSLGLEDQMLTDMILKIDPGARIFTIDTGRLFPETYSLIDRTNMTYGIRMEVYFPESAPVERYVRTNGINAFYESVEKRRECCRIRKLEPLERALSTLDAWICGLRQDQSVTRTGVQIVEWDDTNGLLKVNPLAHCSEQEVWDYVRTNRVPRNALHDRGYPSIGCCPCTRPVTPGEDVRSGRWWWETPEHRECGLHK
ncbi:MAG: phosphoadenylyl-sulfate reductase [Tannerella sp.]|jgi:phosphoadenosine phosphosulfate reductase|nr:phosphoadenylyl-sulfate reductase [Tannerella sp.]